MTTEVSLAGLRVLVTRPEAQAATLNAAIVRAGGEAIPAPMIRIVPLEDPQSRIAITSRLQQLDRYDMALFISSNAARLGAAWIDRYWPQLPVDLELIAIGPATARELHCLGVAVTTAPGGIRSEDLLSVPLLREVRGKRILLFRGRGGRELLAGTLRQRGAMVDYVEVYERHAVAWEPGELAALMTRRGVNVITVTSSQILAALQSALGSNTGQWCLLPLLVPSERVLFDARAAGFANAIDVKGADEQAMLSGLRTLAGGQQQH